ncbi:hypothetical protein CANTEDRAFT_116534 [Yamadazyma tenuis ATCC 10573]|uniref:Uncharacterized protein n=2 Tax=Candida tenuis TaxID=2315449 RepID=G3BE82_CANTC|nr:uncharacterized protein CANTEDRAFT_116534 [Yamadazyma tenuis ATCC 10573]EGV60483.1 hypothetical protein CANTEDRAFT_116534 [Yamadazyma tenuis ATCC 10573]
MLDAHENTKLLLENSILDFESSNRVYINVPQRTDLTTNTHLEIDGTTFKFHKLLSMNQTSQILKEFKVFFFTSFNKTQDFSVVLTGDKTPNLLQELLQSIYKIALNSNISNSFSYSCKAIGFENGHIYDMFDSSKPISVSSFEPSSISSQIMILDDPSNFATILSKLSNSFHGSSFYNFRVSNMQNDELVMNVCVFDVTNLSRESQAEYLFNEPNILHGVLSYCFSVKSFNFCSLDTLEGSLELLKQLEKLR